ncbi:DUF2130 domain-containing protein [Prochlorococcus sp. MIT 1306]|uniref:DUF2130 domain-containing protein n=1 Tax=Prochlorococcus sp. MIT 1306 TaxID=1799667 RepID=UPI0007B345CF|nr:DUF2130 domain-containing protein [Prochlorococcus sp. MIT 1306]KZR64314.1 hypothetical protein PMIT1306_01288 [Prochlorococcus sp. MIT 1306]
MTEVICPNCSKPFKINEDEYANILKQIRDVEFEKDLQSRIQTCQQIHEAEITKSEAKAELSLQKICGDKDVEIAGLKQQLSNADTEKQLAIEKSIKNINQSLLELEKAKAESERDLKQKSSEKDIQIKGLKEQVSNSDLEKELAIERATKSMDEEIFELKSELKTKGIEGELSEKMVKEKYESIISDKDEVIERLKDMKIRMSTKMIGESLEQHCENEFNKIRALAFPSAYFEKDNDVSSGSKGDYIYKEKTEEEEELISIMFEMKNENDMTCTKKKNEDFLKELDKDRTLKGCEYAILVSLLEKDSDLYNTGIVDMSHKYPKMYVVRPQFFIQIITLLRNAAQNSIYYKHELAKARSQHIDITNFETELEDFKSSFGRNYDLASRKFQMAIQEIDKSITHLEKTKSALISSDNNLRIANTKIEKVSVKKLVSKNPTMKAKFENLSSEDSSHA